MLAFCSWARVLAGGMVMVAAVGGPVVGAWAEEILSDDPGASWEVASRSTDRGVDSVVYVEAKRTPGHPAFRVETTLDVAPIVAAATLMEGMLAADGATTAGETRKVLEHSERRALVHTLVDLPFMFDDREVAIRIEHSDDRLTGIHRVEWFDQNDVLPPAAKGVLRLATRGYWEFRPMGSGHTHAIYMTAAEVGGSLPAALGDRLMKGQAVKAVERLRHLVETRGRTHVAGAPPFEPSPPQ